MANCGREKIMSRQILSDIIKEFSPDKFEIFFRAKNSRCVAGVDKGTVMKKKKFIETYTVQEVAEALKLHPYTIRRLCREGEIPAFSAILYGGSASGEKFGGQWKFRKEDIEKLTDRRPVK